MILLGIMIVAISNRKIYFIPGIRNRENPYATAMDENNMPTSLIAAPRSVFLNHNGNFVTPMNSLNLSNVGANSYTAFKVHQDPSQVMGPA